MCMTLIYCHSSFAASGHGYQILDEKIHGNPKFNFHVEDLPPGTKIPGEKLPQKNNQQNEQPSSDVAVITTVPPKEGKVNYNTQVDAYHHIYITNNSTESKIYEEDAGILCDNMNNYFIEHVTVASVGHFEDIKHTFGTVQETLPGSYIINGATLVRAEGSYIDKKWDVLSIK